MQGIKYDEQGLIIAGDRRYTNIHGIPEEVISAILKDRYSDDTEAHWDFSASTLVAPILLTELVRRYPKKQRIFDITQEFWAFFGSIAHQVLEEAWHESMDSVVEERVYYTFEYNGKEWVLSGKPDCYAKPKIRDYKTTKVYKIMKGDFLDWERGQNVYAQLIRWEGHPVESIHIIALLTDWKKGEVYKNNYPECVIKTIPIRLWSEKEAISYIEHRTRSLIDARDMSDQELFEKFPCSSHEMWEDVRDYAVMKNGSDPTDRATKTCDTQEEAEQHIGEKGWHSSHHVLKRMTPRTRCIDWCPAAPMCLQHAKYEGRDALFTFDEDGVMTVGEQNLIF